jgi:signal transduction histidine kinase
MHIELLINNIAFGVTFFICLAMGVLVYIRRPKDNASVNMLMAVNIVFFCIWQLSYVIGVNLVDPLWSRFALMFNLAALMTLIVNTHLVLVVTGRFARQKRIMMFFYAVAIGFIAFFAFNPDLFLLPSHPQLYLPNFFVPGALYGVQDAFFTIILLYLMVNMFLAYRSSDLQARNKLKYFIGGLVYAYVMALSSEFLLYGISIDPIFASLSGLYTIPIAYAILKYDLIDINIIARRALIYALGTAGITLFILFIGYANDYVALVIPGFPQWLLPLISGILGVAVGFFIWKKIQEADYLKFQFVDVVTHKFRTPLTHIKWSAELLRSEADPQERARAISTIEDANVRLFEMTNSLVGLSRSSETEYQYVYKAENIVDMLNETLAAIENQVRTKKIRLNLQIGENLPNVFVDRKRVQFVMQMIIKY